MTVTVCSLKTHRTHVDGFYFARIEWLVICDIPVDNSLYILRSEFSEIFAKPQSVANGTLVAVFVINKRYLETRVASFSFTRFQILLVTTDIG